MFSTKITIFLLYHNFFLLSIHLGIFFTPLKLLKFAFKAVKVLFNCTLAQRRISYIVGQRIYTFRTQKKLSQEALAFESEIHPAYLGRVERGEKCPTIETLYKISKGLKIPLHELLDVSIEVKPTNTEAFHRIQIAMQCLSEEEAVEVAEIIEKLIAFKYPQP